MTTKNIEDIYPLSPMQQGMLFHSVLGSESGVYIEQLSASLQGELNLDAFENAWKRVVERHPILRTGFVWEDLDEPLQAVYSQIDFSVNRMDWRSLERKEQTNKLKSFLQKDHAAGFDLAAAPLMRITVIQFEEKRFTFIWTHHHILIDGWALPLILKEVFACYEAFREGRPPELPSVYPYRNYIAWLQNQDLTKAEIFWRETLKGFTVPTPLAVGRNLQAKSDDTGYSKEKFHLSAELSESLESMTRQHKITLNTIFQAAWGILLSRYSEENDIMFGSTVSGRPVDLPGADNIVGLFINTLPVRQKIKSSLSVLEHLQQLQIQQVELRQYEFSPLVQIQGWSGLNKGLPLFESILVFENYPVDSSLQQQGGSLSVSDVRTFERTNYPLTFVVSPGTEIPVLLAYQNSRFSRDIIRQMLQHVEFILTQIVEHPEKSLGEISILKPSEREKILFHWNKTAASLPENLCAHQVFERIVKENPQQPAILFAKEHLTYQELNERSNQVAHYLRKVGTGPEKFVAICLDRSTEMIIAALAVMKAGGVYIPIDPSYPVDRIEYMLNDSHSKIVLTSVPLMDKFATGNRQLICLDRDHEKIRSESKENPISNVLPSNLAYSIYTSGSTGLPKGTLLHHKGLLNLIDIMGKDFDVKPGKSVLQFASFSFDASVAEIFLALLTGGTLHLVSREVLLNIPELSALLRRQGTTTIILPPSMLAVLPAENLPELETVVSAGEACTVEIAKKWGRRFRFFNGYGPTESTVGASWYNVRPESAEFDVVSVGRPIQNTQLYILNTEMQPVPVGVPGELHIGGVQLARGYLGRPDLTAEKFVPDPFGEPGGRLYKSGDLVRFLPDGNIEFLGRIDHQVKIRGLRIELGEIEAALIRLPEIQSSVVVVREDMQDDKRIVAYVVPAVESELDAEDLREYLKERLPDYMVPSVFVFLKELPLTQNQKVDRRRLPAPTASDFTGNREVVAPKTQVEQLLATIWSDILKVDDISIYDNFFELGGHSLLVTQAVSRIRDAFGIEISLNTVFESPNLKELASHIAQLQAQSAVRSVPKLEKASRSADLPLSFSQQRLWFIDQLEPGGHFYNIPTALHLRGRLYIPLFEKAIHEIIKRHETLRTTFDDLRGKPVQVIHRKMEIQLPVLDLTDLPAEKRERELKRLSTEEARTPFDLRNGPLIRAQVLKLEPDEHIVLFTMHHIIADGWSISILIREIAIIYENLRRKRKTKLPAIGIHYADFATWQRGWLKGEVLEAQLNYWKEKLRNIPPVLELPTDRPRPAIQSFHGGRESVVFSKRLSTEIIRLSRSEGVTVFMVLLTAFQTLLHRYSGQDDIVVGSPVAGRNHSELEKLIGFFVNNLVLRAAFPRNITFRDLLRKVRETALEAYAHQDIPFEKLVEELHPVRDLSHQPIFQVMFVLQNVPFQSVDLPGLKLQSLNADAGTSSFDLTLIMQERPEGMLAEFEYNTDLFDSTTVIRMLDHLQNLLQHAVRDPECRVSELELLSPEEKQLQLEEWNTTTGSYPKDHCVHEWYESLAERHPDAVAATFTPSVEIGIQQKLTYLELNERANQLAHYLRKQGVRNEKLVGISTERSIEMAIGILATLKAGGAFVPIDPTYPADRVAYMIADSDIEVILTQKPLLDGLPVSNTKAICLDNDWPIISQEPKENLKRTAVPDNLAYIIYTSGSTGKPKGTMLRHRGLCNLATAQVRAFGVGIGSKILQFSSLSFDASVWETVMALLSGSTLNLVTRQIVESGHALVDVMKKLGITTVTLPPSVLAVFPETPLPELRTIITAGEKCSSDLVEQWSVDRDFFNAYGPTETTVCASMHLCEGEYPFGPPIGKPIMNFKLYILDSTMNPVPIGVPGELHIGGAGLARGYLKRPDLTAEKFVPNPFSDNSGARLYKSGDLCRYLPDGNIEFLGRIDQQVKIRGFRIELGEVEAVIADFPGTRDVIVISREDTPGDKRLVAYLVNDADPAPSQPDLRLFLSKRLPDYMIPSAFVFLSEMPLTPSKKVDRQALPKPEIDRSELQNEYVAPRNDIEDTLAAIAAELLSHDRVGIHDNFFELGGHSLLATQFISRVRETLQTELPLRVLFEKPTVAEISSEIERLKKDMNSLTKPQVPRIKTVSREGMRVKRSDLTQKTGGSSEN